MDLSLVERNYVLSRVRSEVIGRMLEDIVLLETKMAFPNKKVFKLQFAIGEFDMVVFDPETLSCEIYEIKHSKEQHENQYRHLIDEDKCKKTEFRFGTINKKTVLYRGEDSVVNGIKYKNVENYLLNL